MAVALALASKVQALALRFWPLQESSQSQNAEAGSDLVGPDRGSSA